MTTSEAEYISVPYNFTPRDYQLELFQAMDSGIKHAFLRWHRRAGKDKACWCYMVKEAARVPGNYFYIFPTAEEGRKALWENVDRDGFRTLDHCPEAIIKSKNNQSMLIELKNGSTIRVIGLDLNIHSIRGVACKGAVFSEFAFSDPDAYKVLAPSLREAGGWSIYNSTPRGRNHFYEMDCRVASNDRWFYSIKQTMWPDKPHYTGLLTPEELQEVQHDMGYTDDEMAQEYGVSYTAAYQGAIYHDFIEDAWKNERIGEYPYDSQNWVDTFWDIGYADYTAIWFRQVRGDKLIFIDYFQDCRKSWSYYVQILKEKGYRYRTHWLPHDGKQTKMGIDSTMSPMDMLMDTLARAGMEYDVKATHKVGSKADAIRAVRSRFSRYYFNIERCQEAIKMLSLYHYKYDKSKKILLKEPVHDWTADCADALSTEALAGETSEYDINFVQSKSAVDNWSPFDDLTER